MQVGKCLCTVKARLVWQHFSNPIVEGVCFSRATSQEASAELEGGGIFTGVMLRVT